MVGGNVDNDCWRDLQLCGLVSVALGRKKNHAERRVVHSQKPFW